MWQRWKHLSREDRRALASASWRLAIVRIALALRGVRATQRWLAHRAHAGTRTLSDPVPWQRRTKALSRLSRLLPDTRCLARSLTLWAWLRAAGHAPRWHIGVRPGDACIEGHAWVECDGVLFDETTQGAAQYTPLNWPQEP